MQLKSSSCPITQRLWPLQSRIITWIKSKLLVLIQNKLGNDHFYSDNVETKILVRHLDGCDYKASQTINEGYSVIIHTKSLDIQL